MDGEEQIERGSGGQRRDYSFSKGKEERKRERKMIVCTYIQAYIPQSEGDYRKERPFSLARDPLASVKTSSISTFSYIDNRNV